MELNLEPAQRIYGPISDAEIYWLAEQATFHTTIVEIGSFLGRSTRAMADNTKGVVYALDDWHWNGDQEGHIYANPFYEFLKNMADNTKPIRCDHLWAGPFPCDMVFIDGNHSYAYVKHDVEIWWKALDVGGLICGHDYEFSSGVKQAVNELLPGFKIVPGTDIWYLEKSLTPSPA